MKIEYVQILELDETSERERITRNFKGRNLKLLTQLLDHFVAGQWDQVHQMLGTMTRDQLEYLHPVIYTVMSKSVAREKLKAQAKPRDFKNVPAAELMMGGTLGGVVSFGGLDYPKFKILTGNNPTAATLRVEPELQTKYVIIFNDNKYYYKRELGRSTPNREEAARYNSVEEAEAAAARLSDVKAIAVYSTLAAVKEFPVRKTRRAKPAAPLST